MFTTLSSRILLDQKRQMKPRTIPNNPFLDQKNWGGSNCDINIIHVYYDISI